MSSTNVRPGADRDSRSAPVRVRGHGRGAAHAASLRAEPNARLAALLGPLGVEAPGGQDTPYYELVV